ncbi:MAG: LytR family transcriptional regulator [Clostridia bacterium]|nr:LytR family transcriptional regulator [Clostridia bacterium]
MQLFGGKRNGRHVSDKNKSNAANDTINSESDSQYGKSPNWSPEIYAGEEEKRSTKRWIRRTLTVLGIVVLIFAGAYIALQIWSTPPEVNAGAPTTIEPSGSTPETGETASPEETETPVDAEVPVQSVTSGRREGTYTFAIIGTDVLSGSTDTILVGMLGTEEGKLNVVSIPRDTLVNTAYDIKKVNYIYPACVNNGKDGLEPLLETLEDMLGYRVDSYALVDVEVCAELVDAIGGVWFDVPIDMDWDAPDQDLYIHIKAGYQLLNGEDAVKVMRFRYSNDGASTYEGGDIDRIGVQHDLLMALADQMLTLGNIPNLGKLIDIYEENVTTNVTSGNLAFYAQEFLKLDSEDIHFDTLPANYWGSLYGEGYCFPYIDDWLAMVNTYLNPFNTDITRSNIDMLYSDGMSVYSTQGYIRGGIESFKDYTPNEG